MTESSTSSASVPAGWHLEPGSGRQRWWDGSAWTTHYADADATTEVATAHTSTAVAIVPPTANVAAWLDDGRGRIRWWDGRHWTANVQGLPPVTGAFGGMYIEDAWVYHAAESQPIAGVQFLVESVGQLRERSTLTRTAVGGLLFGGAGMIVGAMFKKQQDLRELYLLVDGPRHCWVTPLDPRFGLEARRFAAWANSVSRQHSGIRA